MSLASWWKKTGVYAVLKHGIKGITLNGEPLFSSPSSWFDESSGVGKTLGNVIKGITGAGLTDAQKEKVSLETLAQDRLNELDYNRKLDFYERFESPEAQVRQYKAAGLNPALMYDSAPGVSASGGVGPGSAGSAGDSGVQIASLLGVLGNLFNTEVQAKLRNRQLDIEQALGEQRIAVDKYKTDAQIDYWKTLAGESTSRSLLNEAKLRQVEADTRARQILNWYLPEQQERELEQKSALTEEARERIFNHRKERELMDAKLDEISAQVRLLNSEVTLNSHRSSEILQRIQNMKREYEKIGKEMGLLDKDIQFYAFNHARVTSHRWNGSFLYGLGSGGGLGQDIVLPYNSPAQGDSGAFYIDESGRMRLRDNIAPPPVR